MVSSTAGNWTVRGTTFVLWALAVASAAYWGLKMSSSAPTGAPVAGARQAPPADPAAVARVLGHAGAVAGPAAAAPLSSRFALVGVVADRSQHGAALIAVDGRPPKPFRVGARVDESLMLQSVQGRKATLAASPEDQPAVTLELPAPAR